MLYQSNKRQAIRLCASVILLTLCIKAWSQAPLETVVRTELNLEALQKSIKTNATVVVKVYSWQYSGDQQKLLDAINRVITPAQGVLQPLESLSGNADDIAGRLQERLGNTEPVTWKILFYDDIIKFSRSESEATQKKLKEKNIKSTGNNQWVYTLETIYSYNQDTDSLTIKPLNPNTDPFPLPLDVFDLSFGLLSPGSNFLTKAQMTVKENDITLTAKGKASVELIAKQIKDSIAPISLVVTYPSGAIGARRLYANCVNISKMPWAVPGAQVVLKYVNGVVMVDLYATASFSFNDVKKDDISLKVPSTVNVNDRVDAIPVLK